MSETVKGRPSGVAEQWTMISVIFLIIVLSLLFIQLAVEVRAQFGVFCLYVDGDAEDASGVDQAFGEYAEDGFMDLSGGRYDESCDGEEESA